jgi:hypothetical protein
MFQKVTPVQLKCNISDAWTTCNQTTGEDLLSSFLPSSAVALFLHVVQTGGPTEPFNFRKTGSSDNRIGNSAGNFHTWAVVGVDASITFQYFLGNALTQQVYLVGYMTGSSGVMFDNGSPQTGTNWAWTEKDLSGICPNAIGIIYEIENWGGFWGIRHGDSTQDRKDAGYGRAWGVIGCSNTQRVDIYVGGGALQEYFYILGYITKDALFNVDAEDISLGSTGAYIDIDLSSKKACLAFIDIPMAAVSINYALRAKGSSEDIYRPGEGQHSFGIPDISDAGFIQGKIANLSIDFWLVGTADKAGGAVGRGHVGRRLLRGAI